MSTMDMLCRAITLVSLGMLLFLGVASLFDEHWSAP